MRLVRTVGNFAGGPRAGQVGWMDDETAEALIARGSAVDCSSLARREGRPEPVDEFDFTDDELAMACEALGLPTDGPRHLLIERLDAASEAEQGPHVLSE